MAKEEFTINRIQTYCDSEPFLGGCKKYRSVFRAEEVQTIYADIVLHNEHYISKDYWKRDIIFTLKNSFNKRIAEDKCNIIAYQKGAEFDFTASFPDIRLAAGVYSICAEFEGAPLRQENSAVEFQVADIPADYGQCFSLEDFSLYRKNEGEAQTDYTKNAMNGFALDKLAAIDVHCAVQNKLPYPYPTEFFVSLFDQTGMLKEHGAFRGEPVENAQGMFRFLASYGSGQSSYWRKGSYRVEVVFMDDLIIEAPFVIGETDVETPFNPLTVQPRRMHAGKKLISASALNVDPIKEIDGMIGLHSFKRDLKRYIDRVSYNRARVAAGYAIRPLSLHSVYLGNPGTGKTTVARLMGKAFNDLGLLTKGHVVVEERSSLTGKFYGTEEEKTNQALERARGGVLFIDEAYNLLVKDDPRDPGRRIIETLLTTLSDEQNRDICIIMAGYTQPMIDMLNDNPGLKSRLPNVYHFDDYTVNELMDIADRYLLTNRYAITDDARAALRRTVELAYNTRDHKFGNGRYIISLLENEVIQNLASRLVAADALNRANSIAIIEKADIPDIVAFVLKEGLGDTVTGTNFTY